MDDSLEEDQLNLWDKLNRLYSDKPGDGETPIGSQLPETKPGAGELPIQDTTGAVESGAGLSDAGTSEPGVLDSAALDEVNMVPSAAKGGADEQKESVNSVCVDCRFDCPQPARDFVISRCRLAMGSQRQNAAVTLNQRAASQGSMGIEKINEICRRCSRSCKQRTTKLNRMLCLGFLPIEDGQRSSGSED